MLKIFSDIRGKEPNEYDFVFHNLEHCYAKGKKLFNTKKSAPNSVDNESLAEI